MQDSRYLVKVKPSEFAEWFAPLMKHAATSDLGLLWRPSYSCGALSLSLAPEHVILLYFLMHAYTATVSAVGDCSCVIELIYSKIILLLVYNEDVASDSGGYSPYRYVSLVL